MSIGGVGNIIHMALYKELILLKGEENEKKV